jgi:hypothetical protein
MTASNPKPNTEIKEGTILFGVSSHHYVIPMVVKTVEDVNNGEFTVVQCGAVNADNKFESAQVRLVFSDLLLIDGEINKESVFIAEDEAKAFALKRLQSDEEQLERKIKALRVRKSELMQ